jgi:hypothetical protein
MIIAVINDTSAADKNADILAALQGRRLTIVNAGMQKNGAKPELTYIHSPKRFPAGIPADSDGHFSGCTSALYRYYSQSS